MVLSIHPMLDSDLGSVFQIETTANRFPWSLKNFQDSLAAGYQGWIGRIDEKIVSFSVVQNILDEAHLLNICVVPHAQSKGFGKQMLNHIINAAQQREAELVVLEVRQSNVRAQQLYLNAGFNEMSVRYGYYPAEKGRENAILMGLNLIPSDFSF